MLKIRVKVLTTLFLLLLCFPHISLTGRADARQVEAGPGGRIEQEPGYRTHAEAQFDWNIHATWESRYVTEGRDNLDGNGLVSITSDFAIDKLSIIPWVADSSGTDYSEFNLNLIYGFNLNDDVDIYAGYTYIRARESGSSIDDNEISLALAYKVRRHLHLSASVYHSFDADGSFMEFSVNQRVPLQKNLLKLNFEGILGANASYIVDGHNGLNHLQLLINLNYQPLAALDLQTLVGYNRAINRDETRYTGDTSLKDFSWAGIGLAYRF